MHSRAGERSGGRYGAQASRSAVWPDTEAAGIVRQAVRITVDEGLFVPARTLAVAAARMNDTESNGIDVVQAQFIRSLSE